MARHRRRKKQNTRRSRRVLRRHDRGFLGHRATKADRRKQVMLDRQDRAVEAERRRLLRDADEPRPCPNCAQGELTFHGVCVECGRVTW